jgi:hypothetical protein
MFHFMDFDQIFTNHTPPLLGAKISLTAASLTKLA